MLLSSDSLITSNRNFSKKKLAFLQEAAIELLQPPSVQPVYFYGEELYVSDEDYKYFHLIDFKHI